MTRSIEGRVSRGRRIWLALAALSPPGARASRCRARAALLGLGAALATALCSSPPARASDSSALSRWLDLESRIQYAYYTEDRRELERIAASLAADPAAGAGPSPGSGSGAEQRYYLALASFRLAELGDPREPAQIKGPAERCASSLDAAGRAAPFEAERLALQSACLRLLAALEPLRAPYLGLKSGSAMRRALELAPRDPRVLLLHALGDRDERRDAALITHELQQSIAAFELERRGVEHVPEWGAAEAYVFLGRSLLEQGRTLAARGALEHALLLVPDFALAHRLMARITAG